jgi:hypothetical protein
LCKFCGIGATDDEVIVFDFEMVFYREHSCPITR